jgi:4-carboxymuconolactone decarboxylase
MDDDAATDAAYRTADRLLGQPLDLPLGPGEPPSGEDFRRLATRHAFGDSWSRTALDTRGRALVSVAVAATLGTLVPLRGQLRIALRNGVSREEIVDLFIHVLAYAGAARAFDSYQVALAVFAEDDGAGPGTVARRDLATERGNKDLVRNAFDEWSAGTGAPYRLLAENATWTIVGNSPVSGPTAAGRSSWTPSSTRSTRGCPSRSARPSGRSTRRRTG